MRRAALLMAFLSFGSTAWASSPWVGLWYQRRDNPAAGGGMSMTIEESGETRTTTYRLRGPNAAKMTMTTVSKWDGAEVPVLVDGKPSAQSMIIKLTDARHAVATIKSDGKLAGTSRSEMSADGKVIKSESEYPPGSPAGQGKQTQYWDKQPGK